MSNDADVERTTPRAWPRLRWAPVAVVAALALVAVVIVQSVRQAGVPAGPPPPPVGCDAPVAPGRELPTGATAVMLCDTPVEPMLHVAAPPDALTTDVAAVVETYRRLPTMPRQPGCTADLGPSFELVFTYVGRGPVRIRGDLYGCWGIGDRAGSRAVFDTFVDRLRAQRSGRGPWTSAVLPPSCGNGPLVGLPGASYLVPTPTELAGGGAVLCVTTAAPSGDPHREVPIEPATWAQLQADLVANSRPGEAPGHDCRKDESPPRTVRRRTLVATNSYGDRILISLGCAEVGGWMTAVRYGQSMRWEPSPSVRDLLRSMANER